MFVWCSSISSSCREGGGERIVVWFSYFPPFLVVLKCSILHRHRKEILARGKDSGGRNSELGKEILIVVSVILWFGLVMIVSGVSGASDCDERVPGLRVMI